MLDSFVDDVVGDSPFLVLLGCFVEVGGGEDRIWRNGG